MFSSKIAFLSKTNDPSCLGKSWTLAANATSEPREHSFIHYCGDGSRLIMDAPIPAAWEFFSFDGYLYYSTNDGATWSAVKAIPDLPGGGLPGVKIGKITSSYDGMKLTAAAAGGFLYRSLDGGQSWNPIRMPGDSAFPIEIRGSRLWTGITSSSDGMKLVACAYSKKLGSDVISSDEYIYTSTDGGSSWTKTTAIAANWSGVASSTNGIKLVACNKFEGMSDGAIYTSSNGGASWTISNGAGRATWDFVASSGDGSIIYASGHDISQNSIGYSALRKSSDSGNTWSQLDAPWSVITDISCSHDGQTVLITTDLKTNSIPGNLPNNDPSLYFKDKKVYLSKDGGSSWTLQCTAGPGYNVCSVSGSGNKAAAAKSVYFGNQLQPTAGEVRVASI